MKYIHIFQDDVFQWMADEDCHPKYDYHTEVTDEFYDRLQKFKEEYKKMQKELESLHKLEKEPTE